MTKKRQDFKQKLPQFTLFLSSESWSRRFFSSEQLSFKEGRNRPNLSTLWCLPLSFSKLPIIFQSLAYSLCTFPFRFPRILSKHFYSYLFVKWGKNRIFFSNNCNSRWKWENVNNRDIVSRSPPYFLFVFFLTILGRNNTIRSLIPLLVQIIFNVSEDFYLCVIALKLKSVPYYFIQNLIFFWYFRRSAFHITTRCLFFSILFDQIKPNKIKIET